MSVTRSVDPNQRRTPRILVADPDSDTRLLYRDLLQSSGSDVVDAVDGRDAMVKALSVRPTLVITELRLPLFDGFALCDVLRRDSFTKRVPIVVVTTENRPAEVDRACAAGADVVLVKPVTSESLLQEIERLLEQPPPRRGSPEPSTRSASRRTLLKNRFPRVSTTTPPRQPPDLWCSTCDRPLNYQRSFVGGVSQQQSEQWDEYTCASSCGFFEYRHRTRKVRRAPSSGY
jgi:two-component system, chemotaxis family, chemotaxis protein CheY